MNLLDPLPHHLARAAEELVQRKARRGRRGKVAGIAIGGALLFGGVAAAASTFWQPLLGDEQRGQPQPSISRPPADQIDQFGVLRRKPTPADRGGVAQAALRLLSPANVEGVRTDYVRVVGGAPGPAVAIVPAVASGDKTDVICLFVTGAADSGGLGCFDEADISAGKGVVQSGDGPDRVVGPPRKYGERSEILPIAPGSGSLTSFGLVPDGVARVRQGDVETAVQDNVFRIRAKEGVAVSQPIVWLNDDGHPVAR